ncbi:hypothetical protein IAT38_005434 [Cryptococcus sp. DSM 104549]
MPAFHSQSPPSQYHSHTTATAQELSLSESFFPPFQLGGLPPTGKEVSGASASHQHHSLGRGSSLKKMSSARDRNVLAANLWTGGLDRETIYSRASSVASVLRSLGRSGRDKAAGVEAICAYVEGKRAKGKSESDIVGKVNALQGMVPRDLGEMFAKARIQSGLARNFPTLNQHRPPPSSQLPHPRRARAPSFSSISSISSAASSLSASASASAPLSASPASLPPAALPETPPTSLSTLPNLSFSDLDSSSTCSSFSAPAPSAAGPYPSPYYAHVQTDAEECPPTPTSLAPSLSSARPPTVCSPLALGGWGREWEKPFLARASPPASLNLKVGVVEVEGGAEEDMIDGVSLAEFPSPPCRVDTDADGADIGFAGVEARIKSSPVKSRHTGRHTMDDSWLSFSESSSSGVLSPHAQSGVEGDVGDWEDDGMTVTGLASSRWSAVWSEASFGDVPPEPAREGPTEAALIRDAYLKSMIPVQLAVMPLSPLQMSPTYDPRNDTDTLSMRFPQLAIV